MIIQRVRFDPANEEHRIAFKVFLDTGRWTVNFFCEPQYSSICAMALDKLAHYSLRDVSDRAAAVTEKIRAERVGRAKRLIPVGGEVLTVWSDK